MRLVNGQKGEWLGLEDVWGTAKGKRCAILGNGPSLEDTPPEVVRPRVDMVIGVNRMWNWGTVDVWLWADQAIHDRAGNGPYPWVAEDGFMVVSDRKVFHGSRLLKCKHPQNRTLVIAQCPRLRGLPVFGPEHLTYEHCHTNTLKMGGSTTVATAIHLALLMHVAEIQLYGCEGHPAEDGRVHFKEEHRIGGKKPDHLRMSRGILETIYVMHRRRCRMVNCSPTYKGDAGWPKG